MLLALTVAGGLPLREAAAQRREVRSSGHAKLIVSGNTAISRRLAIQYDVQAVRAEMGRTPQQLEMQVGVQRSLGSSAELATGGTYVHNTPYGPFAARFPSPERRLWEQITTDQRAGRVALTHRYRVEQRWLGQSIADADGHVVTSGWTFVNRFRYQLRGTLPLAKRAPGHPAPFAAASEEAFVSFGRNASTNLFDQNRGYVGGGMRWPGGSRVELGYLNQLILRSDGTRVENNHTVQLSIAFARGARE